MEKNLGVFYKVSKKVVLYKYIIIINTKKIYCFFIFYYHFIKFILPYINSPSTLALVEHQDFLNTNKTR